MKGQSILPKFSLQVWIAEYYFIVEILIIFAVQCGVTLGGCVVLPRPAQCLEPVLGPQVSSLMRRQ